MVGTTRSRVNFFMNKFRDLGFIEYNGDITINSALYRRPARVISPDECRGGRSRWHVLMYGCLHFPIQSRRTTLSIEQCTWRPPVRSLRRSRNPSFRNLFINRSTVDRGAPIMSARRSREMFGKACALVLVDAREPQKRGARAAAHSH